jgi:hypothetical protein
MYRFIPCVVFSTLCACAGMDTMTIKPDVYDAAKPPVCDKDNSRELCDTDRKAQGFRYFEEAPFLFVHSDGKGGISSEIVWLPDTTKKMSIKPYALLATNKVSLSFTNGMLTESSTTVDETVIPEAVLSAIVAAGVRAAGIASGETQLPLPYLFKITFNQNSGEAVLSGGFPTTDKTKTKPLVIHVTIANDGASQ